MRTITITCVALLALLGLTILALGQQIQHGVTLNCTGVGGGTFSIYRATSSGTETKPALVSGLAVCSYADTSAVVGTKYYYTFTETVGGVESGPSTEVSAQIAVPPSPTNPSTSVY